MSLFIFTLSKILKVPKFTHLNGCNQVLKKKKIINKKYAVEGQSNKIETFVILNAEKLVLIL